MSGMFGTAPVRAAVKSVEWYTPGWVFDVLGLDFDLDPASPYDAETYVPALKKLTVYDDGLKQPWHGRVWLNPPYGPDTGAWMERMNYHGNGVALVFSRTDTHWFQSSMRAASSVLFIAGRIEFVPGQENKHKKSRCGAGTALFAYGEDCSRALTRLADRGTYLRLPAETSRERALPLFDRSQRI